MTEILGRVRQLVERLTPTPVCGACLAERLDGANEDEVNLALSELAVERGFDRENDACGLCGTHRLVIHKHK